MGKLLAAHITFYNSGISGCDSYLRRAVEALQGIGASIFIHTNRDTGLEWVSGDGRVIVHGLADEDRLMLATKSRETIFTTYKSYDYTMYIEDSILFTEDNWGYYLKYHDIAKRSGKYVNFMRFVRGVRWDTDLYFEDVVRGSRSDMSLAYPFSGVDIDGVRFLCGGADYCAMWILDRDELERFTGAYSDAFWLRSGLGFGGGTRENAAAGPVRTMYTGDDVVVVDDRGVLVEDMGGISGGTTWSPACSFGFRTVPVSQEFRTDFTYLGSADSALGLKDTPVNSNVWDRFSFKCVSLFSLNDARANNVYREFARVGLGDVTPFWSAPTPYMEIARRGLAQEPNCTPANFLVTMKTQQMLRTVYDLGYPNALFMQDDIRFLRDVDKVHAIVADIPDDYDIAMLDWLVQYGDAVHITRAQRATGDSLWYSFSGIPDFNIRSLGAIALSRKAIKELLDFIERPATDSRVTLEIDDSYIGVISRNLRAYYSATPACIQGDATRGCTIYSYIARCYGISDVSRASYAAYADDAGRGK